MKTLVIHPEDKSTDFLSSIYENIPDMTLIKGGVDKHKVINLIKENERIIMMGHGCQYGLLSMGNFKGSELIIDTKSVPFLKRKNNIFIWCNADQFVDYFDLKGFYTGMFISEIEEAMDCGIDFDDCSQVNIDESNNTFTNIVKNYVNDDYKSIYDNVLKEYRFIAEKNPIALYNYNRLYYK